VTAHWARAHLAALGRALAELEDDVERLQSWGTRLASVLEQGGRLLTAGNGGSAAEAQHLAAELVGRFVDERRPLSAISLHADTSALTAIANDYGLEECFARQVCAHGRPGDVLVALSTSGASRNILAAAHAALEAELMVLALTGPAPNPLAQVAHDALCVRAAATATIQEVHQVAVHIICAAVDAALSSTAMPVRKGSSGVAA
jgi:D-sedoheptulose 7-phosphate isomerase